MARTTSSRRAARESALRVLYTFDVGKNPVEEVLIETLEAHGLDEKTAEFTRILVAGTLRNQGEIDTELDRIATGFPTDRQTAVDRNILRLAAAEILFSVSDAPPGAVVNEAVELAKKYSTAESGRFVNGVLGTLVREAEARGVPMNAEGSGTEEETDEDEDEVDSESPDEEKLEGEEELWRKR